MWGCKSKGCHSVFPSNVPYRTSCLLQERAAAQLLTAAQSAAQLAGTNPNLLQQLSNASQIHPWDATAISDAVDTVSHMSSLAEQLPWQLRQRSIEQLPDSTREQAGAEDTATSNQAEPRAKTDLSKAVRASQVGSFAVQQQPQQQQQVLGLVSMTGATGSSSAMGDVGMSQDGRREEEAAARAAYRQWSESFEADRVWGQYNTACTLTYVYHTYVQYAQCRHAVPQTYPTSDA